MNEITYEQSLELKNRIYIDVRSPGEYDEDHIPGAVNVPLFFNEERKEIGILYKITGRDAAVGRGAEIVGGRLSDLIQQISSFKGMNIVIACARGGMRSGSVASLMDSLGVKVYRLVSGYKGYRRYLSEKMDGLKIRPRLFVLQGLTGTGKTEIINEIRNSIDLEGMAGHRSSIFGGMGLKQNTQKKFESLLFDRIKSLEGEDFAVIEGESRKIGNLHIPDGIFEQMRMSPQILVTADMDRRVDIILSDYTKKVYSENVPELVMGLRQKIGNALVETLVCHYKKGEIREFVALMLEKYYDPLYSYSMDRYSYIGKVENRGTSSAVIQISSVIDTYLADHNKERF